MMANCFILLVSTKKQYFDLDNFKIFPETHTFLGKNKCKQMLHRNVLFVMIIMILIQ